MDFKKIGLKCGIEIHQQLAGKKLFCNCPTKIMDTAPDQVVRRRLKAVTGETGRVDEAAAHEESKEKEFIYHFYSDCNCLVELDEEPPQPMNKEALETALLIAKMLNAEPVDEIQVMRKTVIDGSNTTGFQRTALVARNGFIEISEGRIRIPTICIEEEAAKIVEREGECDVYNLSRLGIPLIEIGTNADIRSPDGAREAAEKIGMILRSTNRIMRGLGTIRQDVNISIAGGNRVEIKGAQDLRIISKLVEYEAIRQENLIKIANELKKKQLNPDIIDVTAVFSETECAVIKKSGRVLGIKLEGFAGFLGREIMPGRRLGTELSDYAKTAGVGGIFHSDELPNYGISSAEVEKLRSVLRCRADDAFVLVADKKRAEMALVFATKRAKLCFEGVPKEVRKANPDGTTSFLRPMPGEARMYPETDVLPITPHSKMLVVPELVENRATRYVAEYNLSRDMAIIIAKSERFEMFELFAAEFTKLKPAYIAELLFSLPQNIKRKQKIDVKLTQDQYENLLNLINKGMLAKESVVDAMIEISQGRFNLEKYMQIQDEKLKEGLKEIVERHKGASFSAIMGEAMKVYRGKVDGKRISEILREIYDF
ncbi:MAG: Glu-tRNA(Gln) amidotransferase subunit GatE [Candidatus Woesearchaeota archaeon]